MTRLLPGLADALPPGVDLVLPATAPEGAPALPEGLPDDVAGMLAGKVMPALRRLDALIALERAPASGVWETLSLEVHGHSGNAWIVVGNALGAREHVTTWGTNPGFGAYVAGWSACRSGTRDLGTSWDVARRERRVVEYGGPCVVDPGALRLVDILAAVGFEPDNSCEGHPWGAYVGFQPAADDRLARAFLEAGWALDPDGTVARMREVTGVAGRDAAWRETCAVFERGYAPELAAGPAAPAAA